MVASDFEVTARLNLTHRGCSRVTAGPVRPVGDYNFRPVADGTEVKLNAVRRVLSGVKKLLMSRPVQRAMESEVAGLDRATPSGSWKARVDLGGLAKRTRTPPAEPTAVALHHDHGGRPAVRRGGDANARGPPLWAGRLGWATGPASLRVSMTYRLRRDVQLSNALICRRECASSCRIEEVAYAIAA